MGDRRGPPDTRTEDGNRRDPPDARTTERPLGFLPRSLNVWWLQGPPRANRVPREGLGSGAGSGWVDCRLTKPSFVVSRRRNRPSCRQRNRLSCGQRGRLRCRQRSRGLMIRGLKVQEPARQRALQPWLLSYLPVCQLPSCVLVLISGSKLPLSIKTN